MEIDMTQVITSILAVIGSLIGTLSVLARKSKTDAVKEAEREQAQKDQIDNILKEQQKIKDRLDSHNHYAEKFAENSKNLAVMAVEQKNIICSLERLQKDVDYLKSDRCKVQEVLWEKLSELTQQEI